MYSLEAAFVKAAHGFVVDDSGLVERGHGFVDGG